MTLLAVLPVAETDPSQKPAKAAGAYYIVQSGRLSTRRPALGRRTVVSRQALTSLLLVRQTQVRVRYSIERLERRRFDVVIGLHVPKPTAAFRR